ncbi:putative ribonuclease ZC3H12B [Habropoda laboriosa]|uniref:Putative ribonuclease ZC3H12B n=1 Tax=Habropoda laboriosa TaxID=597456 RepID=A0A0L7QLX4_9HYME|nr:putative ribonuclease ZC3H12B [Habropoda laboriosa]
MSALNDSVLICDVFPKSRRKKVLLKAKASPKNVKRSFYESPLKHIRQSSKRLKQIQTQNKLIRNAERISNNKKNCFLSMKNVSLQDSVVILSDNESESNNKDPNECGKEAKKRKSPLEISKEDKQSSKGLYNLNETLAQTRTEEETCTRKRGKKRKRKNVTALSNNSTHCLLISDTEDSEIASIDIDDENIAPVQNSVEQGSDDIVVVWSSTEISSPSRDQSKGRDTDQEQDNRVFMIDSTPNPKNLQYLKDNEEIIPKQCRKRVKRSSRAEEKEENVNDMPFSRHGLKLPKPYNISSTIKMKKKGTHKPFRNLRCQLSNISAIPTITNLEVATSALQTPQLPTVESSVLQSSNKLREIVIDGNNVAMAHTNNKSFSEEGLLLVIDYFKQRGHSVKVFVPQHRRSQCHQLLEKLYTDGIVVFTPSRRIGGRRITPYDDRYILEYATMCGGIVVSLDQYRDLYMEKPEWRSTIENRLLAPTFVGNYVMFPEDPLGRTGPKLEEFLRF